MDIDKIINSYQAHVKDAKPEDVAQKKDATLRNIENVSALAGLLDTIRTAYDLVSDAVTGRYKGVSKSTLALLAGGLAYLALPIDLVPDIIPVVGWADDAAVLTWIFTRCADEFKKYKEFKGTST
ncbi:MAG: DUF1232 domain-containing protein [Kiritimatiellae bacterium]|nr:DUF1232 domain-containing protein [Kiritimatiellia bacterium]